MHIILAQPRGFCAGVLRAISIVEHALCRYGAPVYVRHHIVHNRCVIESLEKKGARFTETLREIPRGARVILSAHGTSPEVKSHAQKLGLRVIDATCPLVTKVHMEVRHYARQGYSILLIGHKDHVEVVGTYGEAPERTTIIETLEDARLVSVPNPDRIAYATQTTLSVDDTHAIVACLKGRFPKIAGPAKDDICYAVQNRQNAVKKLRERADVVFIVGSRASSNANRMKEVALGGTREIGAYLIENADEIPTGDLCDGMTIGVSSAASTPEELTGEVVARLTRLFAATLEEYSSSEDVYFALPKELRKKEG